jgi:hypothetical protein
LLIRAANDVSALRRVGIIKMPISDRREISFDAASLVGIAAASARVAQAIGLPGGVPRDVAFDEQAQEVSFLYADEEQPAVIGSNALAALLISYCMSAGIKIARQLDRDLRVGRDAVVFTFTTSYVVQPAVPANIRSDIARMQSAAPGSAAPPE